MKKFITLISMLFAVSAQAGVFMETVAGSDKIYRGRAPKPYEIKRMAQEGITSVLIFKNQTKDEVDKEREQLVAADFSDKKIHHIPFLWKDIESKQEACEQIVDALAIIMKVQKSSNDKILFHCTVGEDRTGLLAGLVSQLLGYENAHDAYVNQMCLKGYAGGNTSKPKHVSEAVDQHLTPLFAKISSLIQSGALTAQRLNKKVCTGIDDSQQENNLQTCRQVVTNR